MPSKFDRHYNTRLNKRWRNICLSLAGVMLLVVALIALDPVVSGSASSPRALIFCSFLFVVFLTFSLSFHLRYRSRE
jgi:predicted membrane channel-forming protein YqfA (hemolysin III family)